MKVLLSSNSMEKNGCKVVPIGSWVKIVVVVSGAILYCFKSNEDTLVIYSEEEKVNVLEALLHWYTKIDLVNEV